MKNLFDAFISYGRADSKGFATKLHNRLVEQGLRVWFDQNDIPLGVDYQNQIDDGIEKAHNFLFIIAPHSVNSEYCLKEVKLAIARNKRIIPLLHVMEISQETWQQRNPKGTQADWEAYKAKGRHESYQNMHPILRKLNWIYFQEDKDDFEKSLQGLLDVIKRHADYVQQHTQFLAKALEWERNQKQSRYLLVGEERVKAESWLRVRFKEQQPPCLPTDLHCDFISESTKNANNLMTQVFFSYSEKNLETMKQLGKTLRREGFTIWTNKADIKTGVEFQEEINRGIEAADSVIYLISSDSIQSKYCQDELDHAFAHNKRIISLLIEPTDIEHIPPRLRALQFIDCTQHQAPESYQIATDKLIRELYEDADYYQQHKILLVKALKWQRQGSNPSMLLRGHNLQHFEAWLKVHKNRTQHAPLPVQEEFIAESIRQQGESSVEVFISYSRTDADFARQLNETLQLHGKTTWFDQESIPPGSDFQQEIYRGIETSNNFLFIISPNSIKSSYCDGEVEYAKKLNKRIVTVLHRQVTPTDMHRELAKVQWIDFSKDAGDFYANFSKLWRALDTDLEHVRMHTRLLTRAMEWEREGYENGFLLRGKDLATSQEWLAKAFHKQPAPTDLQKKYIKTSQELPFRRPKLRTVLLTSLAVAVSVVGVRIVGLLQPLELAAYDQLMRLKPSEAQDKRLLIVGVTDKDLQAQKKRNEEGVETVKDPSLQKLLEKLQQYKPQVIGLDLLRDFPASQKTNLATVLGNNNRLIGICTLDYGTHEGGAAYPSGIPANQVLERVGFSNFTEENDTTPVRRQPLVNKFLQKQELCPVQDSFSFAIARLYLQAQGKQYKPPISIPQKDFYTKDMQFDKTFIRRLAGLAGGYQGDALEKNTYQILLNYRSYQGNIKDFAEKVSLQEVLDNKISEQQIKDRIIMIGLTSEYNSDYVPTPYGKVAGVILQAQMVSQIVSAILDGRPLIWWWPFWGDVLWIAVWSSVGGIIIWYFRQPKHWWLVGSASLVGIVGICYLIFTFQSGWVPLVPPALALVAAAGIVMLITFRLRK